METIIAVLIILMIIAAIIALEIRDLLSSVVSIGAVGVILTLALILLQCPDVAIVQFVVEILSLVILVRVTVLRDETVYSKNQLLARILVVIAAMIFIIFAIKALKNIPIFGYPKYKLAEYYITNTIKDTGAIDVVSAIILNYRAYDTLGEATVLFTSILGAVMILRKIGKIKNEK